MWNIMLGLGIALAFCLVDSQLHIFAHGKKEGDGIYYASVTALITALATAHVLDNWVHGRGILNGLPLTSSHYSIQGFTFLGGFLGGCCAGIVHLKILHIDILRACNIIVPSLTLGHAIGRLGCFFTGCCYGKLISIFGMEFRIPTQLMEATFLTCLGLLLLSRVAFNVRLAVYLLSYGTWRFFIEFLRGDDRGTLFISVLSPSQLICIAMIVLSLVILFKQKLQVPSAKVGFYSKVSN